VDIAHMKEIAGTMTDLVDALVIHEMNLTNRDLIEGTRILAGGNDRRRPPGDDDDYGRRHDRRSSPPPPPPIKYVFFLLELLSILTCRLDDHLQL